MNRSNDPHNPMKEDARSLWTMTSRDDATYPGLTKKTDGGVANSVRLGDNMAFLRHIFDGSTCHNGRSMPD